MNAIREEIGISFSNTNIASKHDILPHLKSLNYRNIMSSDK